MNRNFDYFGQSETPYMVLCNPNKEELYSLGLGYETKLTLRYNAIGEFSFIYPKSVDGGNTTLPAYDEIKNKKLVLIEDYGYFVIDNVEEKLSGYSPVKEVSCKSLEYELVSKRISVYGGTVKLYDILNPEGTLLYDLLQNAPNWTVGTIETSLLLKYRTFDISDSTIYEVLSGDASEAYECVFIYDSFNRTISAVSYETATTQTDIYMSFDNLISEATFSEKSDEITTCLAVYGGGGLNIRGVNPLGSDKIYDFSYYANTSWMSQGLVDAINAWEAIVIANETTYADKLSLLKTYNGEMIVLRSELSALNSEYLALEGIQKVRIETGADYSDITLQLQAKQVQINEKNTLIANKQLQIDTVTAELIAITNVVGFEENFTPAQLLELNNFIYENTYQNENIIKTDVMSQVEIQDAQEALYLQSKNVLNKVAQPRYEIEFDSANYLELEEFDVFRNQTELGMVANIDIDGTSVESVLLQIELSFDNPSDFSMTFSNRLRLDGGDFVYSDLFGQTVKSGTKVSFDSTKWGNWENEYKDDVTTFISSSLNTANNNIINNSNQEILINQNGLRGRTLNPDTGNYDPTQVWLTSSVLAFSDDGFQTSKLALGSVETPAGTKFGLVGEVIFGNILAGNELRISNSANNFVLDESGATLNNAKFNIQTTNTKIIIDPTSINSLTIQKNEGGTFVNKFWVDNTGNVNLSGNITATSGTIGNISIGTIPTVGGSGLYVSTNPTNYYIKSNGDLKWGALSITGSAAEFTGTIRADRLYGLISYNQITDIPANKITSGTMDGGRISGGTAVLGGLRATGSNLIVDGGLWAKDSFIVSGNSTFARDIYSQGNLRIIGNLYSSGAIGLDRYFTIVTEDGNTTFGFTNGVLTSLTQT